MPHQPKPGSQAASTKSASRKEQQHETAVVAQEAASRSAAKPAADGGESGSVKWSQERRLQFIDFRLQWEGRINRKDVTEFFKISVPQASADIARYVDLAPDNLRYDTSSRTYIATLQFKPAFESTGPRQYLSQLLMLERGIMAGDQTFLSFQPSVASVPLPSRTIEPRILALMLRAIAERAMLAIRYQSIARDEEQERYISPHAFGYDGVRWHVRAYCHLRRGFRDFVFGRILSAEEPKASAIDPADDLEWNTNIELVLKPDVSLTPQQRRGVEIDHGMKNGSVTISCRQAMLFYALRTLNFEINGLPRKGERQLVIANLAEIKPFLPKPGQA
ncbi:helix-turn-helix transcriptional regulator [Cupriavidus pinatubonensis]|uniref:helix-turn-helix transcriptional regulator n=1 Tax=Cupriavidus pinatubonensis TaxID=248026 RepID=UPI00112C007D|nr:WYL domain-containing protein [Cupriavidus pinatubonensis]TPQ32037.1 WYL domain-containing protein [Cupriavidus pinatubonensis]